MDLRHKTSPSFYPHPQLVKIALALTIQIPEGATDWPFRIKQRNRFDALTPQRLASALLDCRLVSTPNETLLHAIDTSAVLSPPDSPLAVMEAQLLGRKANWLRSASPGFLEKLEEDIVLLKSSFQEWRNALQESARSDHAAQLDAAAAELEELRKAAQQSNHIGSGA